MILSVSKNIARRGLKRHSRAAVRFFSDSPEYRWFKQQPDKTGWPMTGGTLGKGWFAYPYPVWCWSPQNAYHQEHPYGMRNGLFWLVLEIWVFIWGFKWSVEHTTRYYYLIPATSYTHETSLSPPTWFHGATLPGSHTYRRTVFIDDDSMYPDAPR